MAKSASINLIRVSKTAPGHADLEKSLSRGSFVAFLVLLLSGALTGGAYFYFSQRLQLLEATKTRQLMEISKESTKEALHLAIKNRAGVVSKVLARQLRADKIYDLVYAIASPPILTGFSVAKDGHVTVRLTAGTIEEIADVLLAFQSLLTQRAVRQPRIESFQLEDDEGIKISVTFFPIP